MQARDIVKQLLGKQQTNQPQASAEAFAPSNIALCKYWGKRNAALNLPRTSSLSVALPHKGSKTRIATNSHADQFFLNGNAIGLDALFAKRLSQFLDLFRHKEHLFFEVHTENNIPTAAGLASSASGFAALVKALNQLFDWQLDETSLSILARLGSGSACRSFWNGFVEWHSGEQEDGSDCFATPLEQQWPGLCLGLIVVEAGEKTIGSRDAMNITTETSPSYADWPQQVDQDLVAIKQAINTRDFELLGRTSEQNSIAMHQTMIHATPSINYSTQATQLIKEKVMALRENNIPVYFTQDAGPNIKVLFMEEQTRHLQQAFPSLEVVSLF